MQTIGSSIAPVLVARVGDSVCRLKELGVINSAVSDKPAGDYDKFRPN